MPDIAEDGREDGAKFYWQHVSGKVLAVSWATRR
jgi:hypothetical protein